MKKLIPFFLLGCIAAAGAFAQLTFNFYNDFNGYLFSAVSPTGLYAKQTVLDENGDQKFNDGETIPVGVLDTGFLSHGINRSGRYYPGSYSFFTTRASTNPGLGPFVNGFRWNDLDTLGIDMSYTTGPFYFILRLSYTDMFTRWVNIESANMETLISDTVFDEYTLRYDNNMFTFQIGNTDELPVVNTYTDGFSDWSWMFAVDRPGVNVPVNINSSTGRYAPAYWRNFVFASHPGGSFSYIVNPDNLGQPEFESVPLIGRVKLNYYFNIPITVDFGMDMGHGLLGNLLNGASRSFGQSRFGGGVRVSGEKLADMLDFDVSYMVRGGDRNRDDFWVEGLNDGGRYQPDGSGRVSHVIGLALGLPSMVPNLGIAFGYTALFITYEDQESPDRDIPTITTTGPFYSGIDLRLNYDIPSLLNITLNNNISFASAKEPGWNEAYGDITARRANLFGGTNYLDRYESQNWFALYNALAVRYRFSSMLSFHLEAIHRMGVFTRNNSDPDRGESVWDGWGENVKVKNVLNATAYANFIYSNFNFQAGLSLFCENDKTTYGKYIGGHPSDYAPKPSWSGGAVGFGIPVRLVFHW